MKKFIPLLIASLFACWSCKLEDTYTETNVRDMVNVVDGLLYNDYGYNLAVVEDAVGASTWKVEGARYLALFDILNRNLDISLKSVLRSDKIEATPLEDPEELAQDPVELSIQGFSGGYLNLGFTITRDKASNNAHVFHFYYKVENNFMKIYIEHVGFGEDPIHMAEDNLESVDRMFSIPLEDLPYFSSVSLVMYCITTQGGEKVIKQTTVNLY